jgi:hypothetical protein
MLSPSLLPSTHTLEISYLSPPPASMRVLPYLPTPFYLPAFEFPYTGASNKPSQDQEPLLPLILDKAILCYMCG